MSKELVRQEIVREGRPDHGRFHSFVYKLLAALAMWFVLAAWTFAGHGQTDLLLMVVSIFILASVGLPVALALVRRRHHDDHNADKDRFGDWASREVEILTGSIKGGI